MILLPISLVTASALTLIHLWLAFRVSQRRMAAKVMIGDEGDRLLLARQRAHANNAEYAPFAVILVALIELARGPSLTLWVLAALFVVARLAHGFGMVRPTPNPLRAGGIGVTWVVLVVLAIWGVGIARQTPSAGHETVIEAAPTA